MRTMLHAAILAVSMAGGPLLAQQPAPTPQRQPGAPESGPPAGGRMEGRMGRPMEGRMERRGPGPDGFRMMIFSPTALLERRSNLNLTPDQVTRLSTLETEVKNAREKAETDAKPHREELEKLWQQGAPDITQIRTHLQALMQAEQTARLSAATSTASAKAVLSPEQRGRVQGWADARMADRRGMRERMFRRGPGRGPGGGGGMPEGGRRIRPGGFGMERREGGQL